MGWKGDKDGNAKEEECLINFEQPGRPRQESHKAHTSSSQDKTRPSSSTVQHKPTNHDRKDTPILNKLSSKDFKDGRSDLKHSHDHRKYMGADKKDGLSGHSDKKPGAAERKDSSAAPEKKELHGESQDKLMYRKDGHGERKEALHQQRKSHQERREHGEHRERPDRKPTHQSEHRDSPSVKTEQKPEIRSHNSSNISNAQKPKIEFEVGAPAEQASVRKESSMVPPQIPALSDATLQAGEMRKVKSESAIHYKDYLKRKEQEKMERERLDKQKYERERAEREKAESEKQERLQAIKQENVDHEMADMMEHEKILKQKSGTELTNKSLSQGHEREKKHRPPKLDISHARGPGGEMRASEKDHNERPYEVNIKSPVKPHYNITVKSPIKSSELKQPRLEITKVHLAPDKDGSDSCSVNINSDPSLKKFAETNKPESSTSNSRTSSHHIDPTKVKIKVEPPDTSKMKQDRPDAKVKVKQEADESLDMDVDLNPEHSAPPTCKIRELGYEPQNGNVEGQGSLKISIKHEGGSGRSTPIINQVKSETGSGSNTPLRTKIILPASGENSPLKLKISTKALQQELEPGTEKYKSPHRHHKHKDKHKSHKHSKDREKHRERHREKHASSSSSSGTNGHPLKMSIKLSDIQGHSSSSNDSWVVKHKHDKHKHKSSLSETSLNKNASMEPERQQPWSMTDLLSKSKSSAHGTSPARKRRRTPTVEVNNDPTQPKAAKTDSHGHRLRRSSSSHSVVSMEMSDGEEGPGQEGIVNQPQVVNQIHDSIQQMIDQTKRSIALQQKKNRQPISNAQQQVLSQSRRPAVIDRQQSGFDLDGMMWSSGGGSDAPPLPPEAPPPLPRYPPAAEVPPPPPE